MSCKPVCKLCDRLVLSQAVTFTGGNLEINLPAGSYNNGEKYCCLLYTSYSVNASVSSSGSGGGGAGGSSGSNLSLIHI